jgi:EAL domain-containing protein (putative c-di-GMP-specific phosphodiesterase class I)
MNYFERVWQCILQNEAVVGAEALLRWNHEKFGFIPPDKIVDIAESIGVIHKLSLWVLKNAIRQCSQWHAMGCPLSVSVNLSVRDLSNELLCEKLMYY